ncbi:MAG TPA: hypothetical protein DCQ96_13940 [Verrucomicrobiales bacterium]|nr:hypothetical protein [Verrucomicrobiales bacterium]
MIGFEARERVADRGTSSRGCGGWILFVQADHFPSRDPFHVEQKGGWLDDSEARRGQSHYLQAFTDYITRWL